MIMAAAQGADDDSGARVRPGQPRPPDAARGAGPSPSPSDAEAYVRVDSLNSGYMGSHILFDVDFEARKGLITVIVGPNGSGKSTLLKSLFGLCTIHSGTVMVRNTDITRMPPHEVARRKIAYLPQVDNVFANLTVRENLVMAAYTLDSREARGRIPPLFETFPVLRRLESAKAGVLSGGERQMLGMAMALMRRPTIMLFDEPTASLSPRLAGEVMDKIREMKEAFGITVVLVEQNVRRSLGIGDRVYLLANGKNVFDGTPGELLAHPELGRLYLGIG